MTRELLIAMGIQTSIALVATFGDIGFDRPGRFGLDFGHLLLLAAGWFLATAVAFAIACTTRQLTVIALQLAVTLLTLAAGTGYLQYALFG